jgi:hypothetical protein
MLLTAGNIEPLIVCVPLNKLLPVVAVEPVKPLNDAVVANTFKSVIVVPFKLKLLVS